MAELHPPPTFITIVSVFSDDWCLLLPGQWIHWTLIVTLGTLSAYKYTYIHYSDNHNHG